MKDRASNLGRIVPLRKRWVATFEFDYRATPEVNASRFGHWSASSAKRKRDREAVFFAWYKAGRPRPPGRAVLVTFTRISPRALDDDNLSNAFKAMRDELAKILGQDDGPRSTLRWAYTQEKGPPKTHRVRVELEAWV